ncbi:MAG: hypothetical protein JW731_16915 [Bacteroidales bacterium]|nr:hypothetical protein [Bacteroidales bacterium]
MKMVLANLAILFGAIGFVGYLFLIIASAFGCCAGLTSLGYQKVIMGILAIAVMIFGICMFNNCSKIRKKTND